MPDRFARKERHRLVKQEAVDPGIVPRLRFFPINGGFRPRLQPDDRPLVLPPAPQADVLPVPGGEDKPAVAEDIPKRKAVAAVGLPEKVLPAGGGRRQRQEGEEFPVRGTEGEDDGIRPFRPNADRDLLPRQTFGRADDGEVVRRRFTPSRRVEKAGKSEDKIVRCHRLPVRPAGVRPEGEGVGKAVRRDRPAFGGAGGDAVRRLDGQPFKEVADDKGRRLPLAELGVEVFGEGGGGKHRLVLGRQAAAEAAGNEEQKGQKPRFQPVTRHIRR